MRIARAMALAGVQSRRKCEEFIRQGEVELNGEIVTDLGRQVDLNKDSIVFRGRTISSQKFVYYILNKPRGYTTTAGDAHAEKTVYELLPVKLVSHSAKRDTRTRVFPVGRLDRDTTGLLLFTNDGDLANHLMHPRYGVGKWYEVRLDCALDPRDLNRLLKGVQLDDGPARAEKVRRLTRRKLQLLIREGRKREVRRIFEALDYEVVDLCRIAFGPILLEKMQPGEGRYLGAKEIQRLKEIISAPPKTTP